MAKKHKNAYLMSLSDTQSIDIPGVYLIFSYSFSIGKTVSGRKVRQTRGNGIHAPPIKKSVWKKARPKERKPWAAG